MLPPGCVCSLWPPGERHLPGLGEECGEEVGEEQEEGGDRPESGGDEEASGRALSAFRLRRGQLPVAVPIDLCRH